MQEWTSEYKKISASSNGNPDASKQERAAIAYLDQWAWNMPTVYRNKLTAAIQEKLKNKHLSAEQIRSECELAIRTLNNDIKRQKELETVEARTNSLRKELQKLYDNQKDILFIGEKPGIQLKINKLVHEAVLLISATKHLTKQNKELRNIIAAAHLIHGFEEQSLLAKYTAWRRDEEAVRDTAFNNTLNGISTIYGYAKWENFTISVSAMEQDLHTKDIRSINAPALAHYLVFLSSQGSLRQDYLARVMKEGNLRTISILWWIDPGGISQQANGNTIVQKALLGLWSQGRLVLGQFKEILHATNTATSKLLQRWGDHENLSKALKDMRVEGYQIAGQNDIVSTFKEIGKLKPDLTDQNVKDILTAIELDAKNMVAISKKIQETSGFTDKMSVELALGGNIDKNKLSIIFPKKDTAKLLLWKISMVESKKIKNLLEETKKDRSPSERIKIEALIVYLNAQITWRAEERKAEEAHTAIESESVIKTLQTAWRGETQARRAQHTLKKAMEIVDAKKQTTELLTEDESLVSYIQKNFPAYTLENLLTNTKKRGTFLSILNSKENLTNTEKKLKRILERLELNEQRRNTFESGWMEKLEKFDKEHVQKIPTLSEKPDSTFERIRVGNTGIPFDTIDTGIPHAISLDGRADGADKLTIERYGAHYMVKLNNNLNNTIELPEEKIPAYIKSLQFLEKIGLWYFIQNLSQNELSRVMELTSRKSVRVNNRDGDFDEAEKKQVLRSFGGLLWVDGMEKITDSHDGESKFQHFFFANPSIETILRKGGLISASTWILSSQELEKTIHARSI